jgi:hypothetical protein
MLRYQIVLCQKQYTMTASIGVEASKQIAVIHALPLNVETPATPHVGIAGVLTAYVMWVGKVSLAFRFPEPRRIDRTPGQLAERYKLQPYAVR